MERVRLKDGVGGGQRIGGYPRNERRKCRRRSRGRSSGDDDGVKL